MVQISLFDFQGPPKPISGEAFQLSPFDALIFTPVGAGVKVGEKVSASIFSTISKFFAPKAILPTSKTVTQVITQTGLRGGGSPFRQTSSPLIQKSSSTGALTSITSKATTQGGAKLTSFSNPFTGKISSQLALKSGVVLGVTGGALFGLNQLTQTPGGQALTGDISNFGEGFSKFITENPLIIAGLVLVAGIMVVKS